MLKGVISMPSNIFATTGTNVSILFLDNENKNGDIVLMDASKLGATVKEGKNQKTILSLEEEQFIINTFINHEVVEDFTALVSYSQMKEKNYSFSAGQYFEVKIKHVEISSEDFFKTINDYKTSLEKLFEEDKKVGNIITNSLSNLKYD